MIRLCTLMILAGLPAQDRLPARNLSAGIDPIPVLLQSAGALPFLEWSDLLYGREAIAFAPRGVMRRYRAALRPVLQPEFGTLDRDKLIGALSHDDPKVRTLAGLALFDSDDPSVLPHLAKLLGDDAETFPAIVAFHRVAGPIEEGSWKAPTRPCTVREVVRGMLDFYTHRVGSDPNSFDEYWTPRAKRRDCTSWFAAHLDRVTGGSSIVAPRSMKLRALTGKIDALPPERRDWVMVAIFADTGLTPVVTSDARLASTGRLVHEEELVYAARRRGREPLLGVLRGESPTDDPDMPHYRQRIVRFILRRADDLLAPVDADEVLELGRGAAPKHGEWFRAAARLSPDRASAILREGMALLPKHMFGAFERTEMMLTLWRLAGPAETELVTEWFFDPDQVQLGGQPMRMRLLDVLSRRYSDADRALLRQLIADERLDQLDSQTTRALVEALNRVLPEPLVATRELHRISHPYGLSHFDKWIVRAKREHPDATRSLLATLADWREKIRAAQSALK